MKVVTITREYGAGGGEVAQRLADALGWEVLDRELLHQAAEIEHVPDAELERLDEKAVSMADRFRLHPPHQKYLHGLKRGGPSGGPTGQRDPGGRGARHLLGEMPEYVPSASGRAARWRAERMARLEGWSLDAGPAPGASKWTASASFSRDTFSATTATQPAQYDLVVNTARVPLEDVAARGCRDRSSWLCRKRLAHPVVVGS